MPEVYDVAIIGLGAMGSAALYRLARAGVSVIGIDRHQPPHGAGSHHGESRITRQAIGEGSEYVPLALRSHEIWRELEAETGERLLHETGCLVISVRNASGHRKANFLEQTLDAARKYSIEHTILDPAELRKRFPQFAVTDSDIGYFEPGGGYLRPERCIAVQLALARNANARIVTGTPVTAVRQELDHVRIATGEGDYLAARAIVSAGAGAAGLLGPPLDLLLSPVRQAMHWFNLEPDLSAAWTAGPTFIWLHGPSVGDGFYGFPDIGGTGSIKVADEVDRPGIDPETLELRVPAADSRRMFAAHLSGRLNGVSSRRQQAIACLYTITPDHRFIIDDHPDADRILLVSPCSGHGFKHSAAIGEAVAQRLTTGTSTIDLTPFALQRFKPGAEATA